MEIAVSVYFIVRVATRTLTTRDMVMFAVVTFLFCIALAHYNQRTREERSRQRKANARMKYDKRKAATIRQRLEADKAALAAQGTEDEPAEDEYTTHPINVQEYAKKLYNGEIAIEDLPETRSRAAIEEEKGRKKEVKNGQFSNEKRQHPN
ncbi:MAG: hypothetical protein IK053_03705, partial [Muribaculaceae bacterium]|nr:hypothetical protein [Muribaculaceae bacterium]